jgi:hypothetical protein
MSDDIAMTTKNKQPVPLFNGMTEIILNLQLHSSCKMTIEMPALRLQ